MYGDAVREGLTKKLYSYKGLDVLGNRKSGVIEATDPYSAKRKLLELGIVLVKQLKFLRNPENYNKIFEIERLKMLIKEIDEYELHIKYYENINCNHSKEEGLFQRLKKMHVLLEKQGLHLYMIVDILKDPFMISAYKNPFIIVANDSISFVRVGEYRIISEVGIEEKNYFYENLLTISFQDIDIEKFYTNETMQVSSPPAAKAIDFMIIGVLAFLKNDKQLINIKKAFIKMVNSGREGVFSFISPRYLPITGSYWNGYHWESLCVEKIEESINEFLRIFRKFIQK